MDPSWGMAWLARVWADPSGVELNRRQSSPSPRLFIHNHTPLPYLTRTPQSLWIPPPYCTSRRCLWSFCVFVVLSAGREGPPTEVYLRISSALFVNTQGKDLVEIQLRLEDITNSTSHRHGIKTHGVPMMLGMI